MPVPQPPRVVGPLAGQPGANSGSGGNNRGRGNPSNPAPNVQGTGSSPCLISWPSTSLPLVGSVGGGCLLSKTNVRAWLGGAMMVAAAAAALPAVIILAAAGFRKTGLAGKAADVAGAVPGGQGYAAALRGLQSGSAKPIARQRQSRARTEAREERAAERRLGEPRENPNLRVGRGAVRETPAETRRRRSTIGRQSGDSFRYATPRDEPPF